MRIGPYEIVGELGRGGMGVVYRARHVEMGREVAIKLMLDPSPSAEVTERFIREVRFTAQAAGHPGIAKIHHAGSTPDGRLFCAMEMIPGKSLQAILADEGPLAPVRAARYVALAAEAMHHAHAQGVLHRDLSPKNIMIDPQDLPRILDFGLARSVSNATKLTVTGAILGTPVYMAPEQVDGGDRVTPLTDVYALGACLYACLTGRAPYQDGPLYGVIAKVLEEDPPPIESVRSDVPESLRNIAYKAMAKAPADRYASAQDLAKDLRAFARGESVAAGPRARRRRSRAPLALAGVAVLLLGAGAIHLSRHGSPATPDDAHTVTAPPEALPPALPVLPYSPDADVNAAIERLRSPEGGLDEAHRLAFRALLPFDSDPRSPFICWERYERLSIEAIWLGGAEPSYGPVARPPEALARLRTITGSVPEAWPAWAAAEAALGADERVLDQARTGRWHDSVESRLVVARLHLVRGEPEDALRALEPCLEGTPRPEVLLLHSLARLMEPDLGAAWDDLARLGGDLRAEATLLRALITRIVGGRADAAAGNEAQAVVDAEHLGTRSNERERRHDTLEAIGTEFPEDGDLPADLAILKARVLLDSDRFADAVRLLAAATRRDPGNWALADAYFAAIDLVRQGTEGDQSAPTRLAGTARDAAVAASRAEGVNDETFVGELLDRHRDACPGAMAHEACYAELPAADRWLRRESAFGADALSFGLAGRLLDRALRGLVRAASGRDLADWHGKAAILARMAYTLSPGCQSAFLLSGLHLRASPRAVGEGHPIGWGLADRFPAEMIDTASLRAGLPVPLLVVQAEGLLDEARGQTEAWEAENRRRRALRLLEDASAATDDRWAPEMHLLHARCLRDLGISDGVRDALDTALRQFDELPLAGRSASEFLDEAGLIERHLSGDEAPVAANLLTRLSSRASEGERATFAAVDRESPAWGRVDDLGWNVLPMAPTERPDLFLVLAGKYAERGNPRAARLLWGRGLRLGAWHLGDQTLVACSGFAPIMTLADTPQGIASPDMDETVAIALILAASPGSSSQEIVRGLGLLTSLLAFGVAPGPLLAARAYARLRLGDVRGALADAAAATEAVPPLTWQSVPRDQHARLAILVHALATSSLAAEPEAVTEALRADDSVQDLAAWRMLQFGLRDMPVIDSNLAEFAAGRPVLQEIVPDYAR